MSSKSKKRKPLKPKLGLFQLKGLVTQHKDSPVFVINAKGHRSVEPWLKELRFQQALYVASQILGREISEGEFHVAWSNTPDIEEEQPAQEEPVKTYPPNTATFGGFRLKRRSALHQHSGTPKKRKW